MSKKFYIIAAVSALLLFSSALVDAQKPAKKAAAAPASGRKPNVRSRLGELSGSVTLGVEKAKQLVSLPIRVTDDHNLDYAISSYQFAYKRIGVTEDEETGKTSPQSAITADRFTTTPLPPVWQKNIIEGLHAGEELYFFDIIVFDKNGRRFFAPEIKIAVQ